MKLKNDGKTWVVSQDEMNILRDALCGLIMEKHLRNENNSVEKALHRDICDVEQTMGIANGG